MKYNTMMALAVCGALAFAVTGCKYDDVAEGGDVDGGNVQAVDTTGGADANANAGASDFDTVLGQDGKPATELKFDQASGVAPRQASRRRWPTWLSCARVSK